MSPEKSPLPLFYPLRSCLLWLGILVAPGLQAQTVYVDPQGVLRYSKSKEEAAFFGVNYTAPFAYGYRAHQALGADIEKAIDQDVYHLARLGMDAFRVHVWDVEISDSLGNLLANEHLRLYDYLLYRLKERGIKTIITPIAFWGNGYPERDEATPGFSSGKGKSFLLRDSASIAAQENYLRQFFRHLNPYTQMTYGQDPDILATEINNEPHHGGPAPAVTDYINRMAAAIRSTGWKKPVYYNISESPAYARAVAKAEVEGISFQWYPSNLVANHTQEGNFLPYVDEYKIPFGDSIPEVAGKSKMVYEFDAADILAPIMYPPMARSFRKAGMQWATQFAYDPLVSAYANTEYQTHYVNLAYTPAKAISLLIAGEVFRRTPRGADFGRYPADSTFGPFRVSYAESLSEMVTDTAFYYSNSTRSTPKNPALLKHIAGVGHSPLVQYQGSGAYFLDQLEPGIWRLELMPDAVFVSDPFARASLKKEVSHILWQAQQISLQLPDLGTGFRVRSLRSQKRPSPTASDQGWLLEPGVYLLSASHKTTGRWLEESRYHNIRLDEFAAPESMGGGLQVIHQPASLISAGQPFLVQAKVLHAEPGDSVFLQINQVQGWYRNFPMTREGAMDFSVEVPADLTRDGLLQYKLLVKKVDGVFWHFPGGYIAGEYEQYRPGHWETFIAAPGSPVSLFDAARDRETLTTYIPGPWQPGGIRYSSGQESGQLLLQMHKEKTAHGEFLAMRQYCGDRVRARMPEVARYRSVHLQAAIQGTASRAIRVTLVLRNGAAFSASVPADSILQDLRIPLDRFEAGPFLLIPRPYPGFQPLWFQAAGAQKLDPAEIDAIQISTTAGSEGPCTLILGSLHLSKTE